MNLPIAALWNAPAGEYLRTANRVDSAKATLRSAGGSSQPSAASEQQQDAVGSAIRDQSGALATKQAFLTLLVAQIKNQNPLNPTDGTEFLSQLAQFSELEQLISIREELEGITAGTSPAGDAAEG